MPAGSARRNYCSTTGALEYMTDIIVDHRSVVVVLPLVPFPNDGR